MDEYKHKEMSASVRFYGTSMFNVMYGKYPNDIKPEGKKTGRMRKVLRRSMIFRYERSRDVSFRRMLDVVPLFTRKNKISLHRKRKESRGFVSNRKPVVEGARVEWEPPYDTGDK